MLKTLSFPSVVVYVDNSPQMSYSLNSLKGVIWGNIYGTTIGVIKGDTRSLDSGSDGVLSGYGYDGIRVLSKTHLSDQ